MKKFEVRCPECGGVMDEADNSRDLIGKRYICDGPHDEDIAFTSQFKDVSHKRKLCYNKLVRDRIPEIIEADGVHCEYHVASAEEYERLLHAKLLEEANEFIREPNAEELADILEVVDALRNHHRISINDIKHQKMMKRSNRGGFDMKYILEVTEDAKKIKKHVRNK